MSSSISPLLVLAVIHPSLAISHPRISASVIRCLPMPYASQRAALIQLVKPGMSLDDVEQILGRKYWGSFSGPAFTGTLRYDDVEVDLLRSTVQGIAHRIKWPKPPEQSNDEDQWYRDLESRFGPEVIAELRAQEEELRRMLDETKRKAKAER